MCTTSVQTADHNFPSQEVITNLKRLCGWLAALRTRKNQYAKLSTPLHTGRGEGVGLLVFPLLKHPGCSEGGTTNHHRIDTITFEGVLYVFCRLDIAVTDNGYLDARITLY